MKRLWLSFILSVAAVITLPGGSALQAQGVSAWFRGSKAAWEQLTKQAFVSVPGRAAPAVPFSQAATGLSVKTTAHNWMLHKVGHSGVFCRVEKDLLLQKNTTEKALLGKLAYFHDRDARIFNALGEKVALQADENAFWRHQNLLENTLAEIEAFYQKVLPERFSSEAFSAEQVARLLADPVQPPAFVLHAKEMRTFAAFSSLAQQKEWTNYTLRQTMADLNALLSKQPGTLKPRDFERYYLQKLRLNYFATVKEVLDKSTDKRPSLIIRRKRVLPISLPGAERPMTDAQRLGFLYYHLHTASSQAPDGSSITSYLQIKTLLAKILPIYEPYAIAEAFHLPYEAVLQQGAFWADLMLGQQTGQAMRNLNSKELFRQVPPRLAEIENKLSAMRQEKPVGLEFFVSYYRLEKEKELYEAFLSRARLMGRLSQ